MSTQPRATPALVAATLCHFCPGMIIGDMSEIDDKVLQARKLFEAVSRELGRAMNLDELHHTLHNCTPWDPDTVEEVLTAWRRRTQLNASSNALMWGDDQ